MTNDQEVQDTSEDEEIPRYESRVLIKNAKDRNDEIEYKGKDSEQI